MKCSYRECTKILNGNNSRQLFCTLSCKNKEAFEHRKEADEWEIEMARGRKINSRIIENLRVNGHRSVNSYALNKMGFRIDCLFEAEMDSKGRKTYRCGNYRLIALTEKSFFIRSINFKKNDQEDAL
jgi:hypothetical protein